MICIKHPKSLQGQSKNLSRMFSKKLLITHTFTLFFNKNILGMIIQCLPLNLPFTTGNWHHKEYLLQNNSAIKGVCTKTLGYTYFYRFGYIKSSSTWNASTFPSLYCTWLSTTSLLRRRISRHKWNAFPKRDFLRSWKSRPLTLASTYKPINAVNTLKQDKHFTTFTFLQYQNCTYFCGEGFYRF